MLDIVVYVSGKEFMLKNINCINLALSSYDGEYRIHKYSNYSKEFDCLIRNKKGKKIYILDVEVNGVSGLEVATKIRKYDWDSIIIIATENEHYNDDLFYVGMMILDFVHKCKCYERRLVSSIKTAISIVDKQRIFTFKYNYVVYRIPYNQICYIEKEPDIKRCIIHTVDNQYYITGSVSWILAQLNSNFCRTHQSCIVNLNNIKSVNFSTNTIIFKNDDTTDMLTVKMKKEIKKYVGLC